MIYLDTNELLILLAMDWKTKSYLCYQIKDAIERSIEGLSSKQEPDYIAALVTRLPSQLSSILGTQYNVGGCFVHQKPCARFCDSAFQSYKKPEIGDLLIVYKEIEHEGHELFNSLLLQAKKTDNIYDTTVSQGDIHQLILYTKWPKFTYFRAGNLNGVSTDITPKTITTGAQYLLINENDSDDTPCGHHTFWCASARKHLIASKSLALQIIDLIEFQTGRPFVPEESDDWSKMIWDLLKISAHSYFNRRKAHFCKTPRGTGIMDFFTEICKQNQDQVYIQDNEQDGENSGVSVLFIERISHEQE